MKGSSKRNVGWRRAGRLAVGTTASTLFAVTMVAASAGDEPLLATATTPSVTELANGRLTCTIQHLAIASERQQRIADAATVEEARDLALTPVRAARQALQVAALVAPSSEKLAAAREKLDGFEARVGDEKTPAAVAGEFGRLLEVDMRSGNLVEVADLSVRHANVHGPGHCHYSTGEIVAIVFGFILCIIPGIILLFVLC